VRVLQVHKDFEPYQGGGGTARHIHGLGTALVGHGCTVRVIAPAPEDVQKPYSTVAATRGDFAGHIKWADVVHVHGARSSYAAVAAVKAKMAGKPFFYTPHAYYDNGTPLNNFAKKIWDRTAEKFLLEAGAKTFLLTPVWREVLSARGISMKNTAIIPNCVTGAELSGKPQGPDIVRLVGAPSILSVGRLDPVKRLRDVITALTRPELSTAHLHIVGKGSERDGLAGLAQSLGVASRVTLHGFVSDADVLRMVGGADLFILASEQEGLPTVLLEMLIAELPIACSRIPGNMAIASVAGVTTTFEVGDTAGMAAAIQNAASSTVSAGAIKALRDEFTWEKRAGDILAIYRAACGAR
jgi:glycosyltransferase involved in cell wall biosynthesis